MDQFPRFKADLFGDKRPIGPGAFLLEGYALSIASKLMLNIKKVSEQAPFRHMSTRMGFQLSVAMTNCGKAGWVSDARGYRYVEKDPLSGKNWPEMPELFSRLAREAAAKVDYICFSPDACLINCYKPGAEMGLHQDRDESDYSAPIVSVSLGLPATFVFGGLDKSDPKFKILLNHGDVLVWGGPSRLFYHGILPLKSGTHPLTGQFRYNLTFRKALS